MPAYFAGLTYSIWETFRAANFIQADFGGHSTFFDPGTIQRATDGIKMLFDQNTGDGTIMAIGFFGAELLLLLLEKFLRNKLGKSFIKPSPRFVISTAAGIALATYLESTTIFNNTIDLPDDLFGIGLAASIILATKSLTNLATRLKLNDKLASIIIKLFERIPELPHSILD